jgi:hypothetical protein
MAFHGRNLVKYSHFFKDLSSYFITDREKLFNRPKPLISLIRQQADIFNLGVFFFLQYFIAYGEFRVADKVL